VAIDAGADHLVSLNMSLALNGWLDRARLYHGVASAGTPRRPAPSRRTGTPSAT